METTPVGDLDLRYRTSGGQQDVVSGSAAASDKRDRLARSLRWTELHAAVDDGNYARVKELLNKVRGVGYTSLTSTLLDSLDG